MISESYKKYCCEDPSLIENYDLAIADTTQIWEIHHRRGTIYSRKDLKEIGEYYNRPAIELVYLTKANYNAIHARVQFKGVSKGPMSEGMKGVRAKKILQFTKSGEFVREWPSAREAHRELGISQGNICACCNDKRKFASGYIWRYAE